MILFQEIMKLFFLFSSLSFLPIVVSNCTQTCGSKTVPYPFGFSAGCNITLSCTRSDIRIGGFLVRNITSESLFVDIPPSCNRSIAAVQNFFGPNYAMKRTNGLFLRTCSSAISGCLIPTELIADRLNLSSCGAKGDNMRCFADPMGSGDFLSAKAVEVIGCEFLFTSVRYEVDAENHTALVFSTVELGWWMEGECQCSANASCRRVQSPVSGKMGFRCRCNDGFEGDGFAHGGGAGCVKARISKCGFSENMSGNCGRSHRSAVLLGGIIAGACLLAGLSALLYFFRRRRSTSSKLLNTTKRLVSEASFSIPLYPYKAIERATDNFSDSHRLGTGAYGTVYIGHLNNGDRVAVKKLKHPDPENIDQITNEIRLISSLNHPNLVRLLGCCIERGEQILVYEFMPNGTLSQHLQRQRGSGLPWPVRLDIAVGTAKAIAYLHSAVDPPIYHRDIKSSNILLDQQFSPKIADFGLSRMVTTEFSHISTAPQGTPGYVDPQYQQNFYLSDKSDVYSFGVVLVEMITGMKVVDFSRVQSEVNLAAMAVDRIGKGRVEEIIDPFLGSDKDGYGWILMSINKVAELAFQCLAFDRDTRPSMTEVADELEQIRHWKDGGGGGDVGGSPEKERCSSPLMGCADSEKSRRLVLGSGRQEGKTGSSPVSVQDTWVSDLSTPSSSSLSAFSKPLS